jgi:glucose-1-phosphate cytidylyltransferase
MVKIEDMSLVILCGGKGTRMGNINELIPKPLIKIGDMPVLWHIMKYYSVFGIRRFILCTGYLKEQIEGFTKSIGYWDVACVDTGEETNTGGRIKRVEDCINSDLFMATYGDGLSDIDLNKLLEHHRNSNIIATLTAVQPINQFGIVEFNSRSIVTKFIEKPKADFWINGGFFVFNKEIFNFIKDNDILEKDVFNSLVVKGGLSAFLHNGFWQCMDTYKDNIFLNEIWNSGEAKWKIW